LHLKPRKYELKKPKTAILVRSLPLPQKILNRPLDKILEDIPAYRQAGLADLGNRPLFNEALPHWNSDIRIEKK